MAGGSRRGIVTASWDVDAAVALRVWTLGTGIELSAVPETMVSRKALRLIGNRSMACLVSCDPGASTSMAPTRLAEWNLRERVQKQSTGTS